MKAIVIGSGMSGLTVGAYLARAGLKVRIFEQFSEPGGVTATLKQGGYGWDLGPLLLEGFGPGDRGRQVLEELGVAEQVAVVREDRGLVLPDFPLWKPTTYAGPYWRRDRLAQLFPDERENLWRYYRFYDQVLDLMSLARRSEGVGGALSLWWKARMAMAFRRVKWAANWNARQLMDHYFHHEAIKTLFTAIVADFVTKPSEFPALGVPAIHLETAFDKRIPAYPGSRSARVGYYYILGGCQSLVQAVLSAFLTAGGQLTTGVAVEKIVIENKRVIGVELSKGGFEPADVVVASGGARETFDQLIGKEHLPQEFCQRLERNVYMESVFMVHLGIDFDPAPYQPAALCYYYGTYDLEESIERLRGGYYHEGQEGFLIYIPSMHSPQLAPPGCHAVTIYTIAPNDLSEGNWQLRREELADKLVAQAERFIPGLREHTRLRVIFTPEDFRLRTHQKHHSFGGIPPVIGNHPPAHRTPIQGLWFVGSQSESGGGVMNVTLGGRKTARLILAAQSRGGV